MIDYIYEIQQQLCDVYNFPRGADGLPVGVPDGEYPMNIKGRRDAVRIVDGQIHCCRFDEPVRLVGISGRAGAGKDTVGRMLVETVPGARTVAFAEPMKRFVSEIYDWPLEKLEDLEFKETPDPRYVRMSKGQIAALDWVDLVEKWHEGRYGKQMIHEVLGLTLPEYVDWVRCDVVHLTPRRALQIAGTEIGRACYQNTWVDLCMRRVQQLISEGCPLVVTTDCRFENEADAILARGGEVIRVERPGTVQATHASEAGCKYSLHINNDGTLSDLRVQVAGIVSRLTRTRKV